MKVLKLILVMVLIQACSSAKEKPSRDVCSIEKHYKDNLFRVKLNGREINEHWYLHEDALAVARQLAERNKCMP